MRHYSELHNSKLSPSSLPPKDIILIPQVSFFFATWQKKNKNFQDPGDLSDTITGSFVAHLLSDEQDI